MAISRKRYGMYRIKNMVGVVRSFQSPFRNFLACYFSTEPESTGVGGFWYNKLSLAKHSNQASVSWCYWALRVEYPVYQEGVIDREKKFFGSSGMSR